ncbi:MAG: amidohydrolase family protein [Balneolales bacterium]|nr:amidohydrolase family protein [Balneolales bacterium]
MKDSSFFKHVFGHVHRSLLLFIVVAMFIPAALLAQAQTSPVDGMHENTPRVHAFTNATIITAPGNTLTNATLVVRNGIVEAVGRNVSVPADARVWNMQGRTIYPGFIDAHSHVGMQDPRVELDRGNASWNPQLRAHLNASSEFNAEDDGRDVLRKAGFTTVASVPTLGIFRGQTAVFSLSDAAPADRLVRDNVAHSISLTQSREFGFTYPTSPIGVIAMIRQTLYDARWHHDAHEAFRRSSAGLARPEFNAVLAALEDASRGQHPVVFDTRSDEEVLRVLRIAGEFDLRNPWIKGSGHEYRIADYLKDQRFQLILPIELPSKPDIDTPEEALNASLAELRHWYLAPENAARLAGEGIRFSFTANGLSSPAHILRNLRYMVHAGLSADAALAALTVNPAELLGIAGTHGTIERGKTANFVVTDGDIFKPGTRVMDVWTDGHRHVINRQPVDSPAGVWSLVTTDERLNGELHVTEARGGRLSGKLLRDGVETELKSVSYDDETRRLRGDFLHEEGGSSVLIRLTASLFNDRIQGWGELSGEQRIQFQGHRTETAAPPEPREQTLMARDLRLPNVRPAMEYGRERLPEQPRDLLVRNATIWTMGEQGILENADLLVRQGRIVEVGQNLRAPRNATIIDAEGKHVTPGLIDAHLHSGVTGVNEVGNAITAEVRMGDVLTIDNIWMYRQLAGGLTTAHVMHGSANAIGGQNVTLKMRWGALSHDLPLDGARRTIKFALGENPKRVGSNRYPDTRMGVEQIIADRFRMAEDYRARWQDWERNRSGIPPRRDLRLDALVDILAGDLDVHSHSYRQDEILMLMRLADDMGFRVTSFHHSLEAFKVAPELAARGIGAVVWSDWGGFKIEAYDNTNYNARLLHEAGVVTSLHSDDSQIATRMNWEAAKLVRTGVDREVALSMVTSRTAELLGIADRVGSLEPGKDADFVIWSGDPLSTMTIAEQTWVDGRRYFDVREDAELQRAVERERAALIRLIMEGGND